MEHLPFQLRYTFSYIIIPANALFPCSTYHGTMSSLFHSLKHFIVLFISLSLYSNTFFNFSFTDKFLRNEHVFSYNLLTQVNNKCTNISLFIFNFVP